MKVYRIAYLGDDGEAAMGLETALKGDGFQFLRAGGDYQGMEKAATFNADIILWDRDNLPPEAPIPIEQIRNAGLIRQAIVGVIRSDDIEGAVGINNEGKRTETESGFLDKIVENLYLKNLCLCCISTRVAGR